MPRKRVCRFTRSGNASTTGGLTACYTYRWTVGRQSESVITMGGMMRHRCLVMLAFATLALFIPAAAFAQNPDGPDAGGASEVTVGSDDSLFSGNKQNEPVVMVNPVDPNIVVAGANDNIDLEACNVAADNDCPFTEGVGVTGVQFSFDGGHTWNQPTYSGWTARDCDGVPGDEPNPCTPHFGPIGTLPWYFENGLVSDGDPAVAFGPVPDEDGDFAWANGVRLYFANLTANFSADRSEQEFKGQEAIAVSRMDNPSPANYQDKNAWMDPVIVSRQNAALFSDKEQVWADNAESSPFFGNAYICNVAFRSFGGAPEPVVFNRSTDGGETWKQRQLSAATNTNQTGGRQGCTVRTDSEGVVYVFWIGTRIQDRQSVMFMTRSFNGGVHFEKPQVVAEVDEVGLFDPVQGRFTFDGVAGARTNSFPSADIANGAPTGADATDTILLGWSDGPTPTAAGEPNEEALFQVSNDQGETWTAPTDAAPAGDRPDFAAFAIAPDGSRAYATYTNFLQPWQTTTATPRLAQGVVLSAPVADGVVGSWSEEYRGPTGDARGSSANSLTSEFLGDYSYASASRDFGVAVWNDVRQAADCTAIDAYRQALADGEAATAPAPNNDCPQSVDSAFGNSDIWGFSTAP
jgi:hypothetical protein